MTAVGRARMQQWAAWIGGMMVSALTATAAVAFFFGGERALLERHDKQITSLEERASAVNETVQRLALSGAESYLTKREGREIEARIDARLTRIEDKLDRALGIGGRR